MTRPRHAPSTSTPALMPSYPRGRLEPPLQARFEETVTTFYY
ncbi:hypothetical protein [Streptomyces yaizuensis]|uniref:Uncharacterized protein n=1 Tax=Streptomyces yaizuensis TaxID=2989713 RepID=A0ABQ5NXU4_9ACTN|nr:hypothetical protein [Streptomyces sp. YSPA8]GLF95172.1 hypothetical protein SYYSPA8_12765 [Streptomyces sp. YSPA8]